MKPEEQIQSVLLAPFKASDIEWRMQSVNKDKVEGFAVPYVDNRAIQARLDAAVGIFGWRNEFKEWQGPDNSKKAQLCTIFIFSESMKTWVGKSDGADNSDIEAVKGGLSDSMKRAAVEWGIGRFLYEFEPQWIKAKARGGGYVVPDEARVGLDNYYNGMVEKLAAEGYFGSATPTQGGAGVPPAKPSITAKLPEKAQHQSSTSNEPKRYLVLAVKAQDTVSGRQTHLKIKNEAGETVDVFLRTVDPSLVQGCTLTNVRLNRTTQNGIKYIDLLPGYSLLEAPTGAA